MKQYEAAWKTIIYPEQMPYEVSDLGPDSFKLPGDLEVKRVDFGVKNQRKETLKGSFYYNPKKNIEDNFCVVFCNSRNGNRLQGKNYVEYILKDCSLCVFDFSGSGHSDGKFCTLGQNEKDDLEFILNFLRDKYNLRAFILWGRSMGSVSAVAHWGEYEKGRDKKDKLVKAMILDSPYGSSYDVVCMPTYLFLGCKDS